MGKEALTVLERLRTLGYKAYLVGGAVRDLYLQRQPKDYDVATDARPSRLKKVFRNCRIIGRRFRIAHVFFPNGITIEVATFRQSSLRTLRTESGVILRDNEFGTPQQDALRRDLTINGLFYDIATFSVIDYVGGVEDITQRRIRTIAEPNASFREDPVRMIRTLRHAARTGFTIEEKTLEAIYRNRQDIVESNPARLLEELFKDLRGGAAKRFFASMIETHLLDSILPALAEQLRAEGPDHPFWRRMESLDRRTLAGETFTNPVLLSLLLHTLLFPDQELWTASRNNPPDVWRYVSTSFRELTRGFRISRRDMERVAQITIGFRKLRQSFDRQRLHPALASKPYLSEALDFLAIDLESQGLSTDLLGQWKRALPPRSSNGRRSDAPERDFAEGFEPAAAEEPDTDGEAPRRRRRRRGQRRGRSR
jgi:poly(A) polymerase